MGSDPLTADNQLVDVGSGEHGVRWVGEHPCSLASRPSTSRRPPSPDATVEAPRVAPGARRERGKTNKRMDAATWLKGVHSFAWCVGSTSRKDGARGRMSERTKTSTGHRGFQSPARCVGTIGVVPASIAVPGIAA